MELGGRDGKRDGDELDLFASRRQTQTQETSHLYFALKLLFRLVELESGHSLERKGEPGTKMDWSPVAQFTLNFIAIVPLASLLAFATEELAVPLGQTLGGLLNATFGNAVELIV